MQIDENTIVYRPDVPDRNALIELYDILNQVNMREKRNDLFYTEEQVAELKKDTRKYLSLKNWSRDQYITPSL